MNERFVIGAEHPAIESRTPLESAIDAAVRNLLAQQRSDGHWCAELEGDTILESEYSLLFHFLGRADDPRVAACCRRLRSRQLDAGGWAIHPGGATDASASVKAYLCLKLGGDDVDSPHMRAARRAILDAGGLPACNSFTKLYLAIFGLWSWKRAPAVPPEIILLPRWFYFNLYEMSAWSRTIVVPLSIIWALKPRVALDVSLAELSTGARPGRRRLRPFDRFWSTMFVAIDHLIKLVERVGPIPTWRRRALERAERWTLKHMAGSDGLGAIYPPMMNAVIALCALGYDPDHPAVRSQLDELERFEIAEEGELRLQPCLSPVWDTALSLNALLTAGCEPSEPRFQQALEWLLDAEIRTPGDWREKSLQDEPGGWCFEYRNDFYPDCDDTAEVLAVLASLRGRTGELEMRRQAASVRGRRWLLGLQNPDGGWGAFDRRCNREVLTRIPFADHNAMIDPSTSDITARSIMALLEHGHEVDDEPVRRAVRFLLREQERDGCWYGRWGANYIYGTWLAVSALAAVRLRRRAQSRKRVERAIRHGRDWLLAAQNDDGGWGETLQTYDHPALRGNGDSTMAQTAWAMSGLIAADEQELGRGEAGSTRAALDRAASFLLQAQRPDGSWYDEAWTGVGFPSVFYLRYHLYAEYFPLEALALYRRVARPNA